MSRFIRKGQAGIGTIITFISIILVVTIAAGVLIQTSQRLQSRALATGSSATRQVANFISVKQIYGEDAVANNYINQFYLSLQVAPGSQGLNFNDLHVSLVGISEETLVEFNSVVESCDASSAPSGKYDVNYILNNSVNSKSGYLMPGDLVEVCFQGHNVYGGQPSILKLIPRQGQETTINFIATDDFSRKTVHLYP